MTPRRSFRDGIPLALSLAILRTLVAEPRARYRDVADQHRVTTGVVRWVSKAMQRRAA